jgi:hypothetical protein
LVFTQGSAITYAIYDPPWAAWPPVRGEVAS